jgi:hypothetical protein
MITNETSSERNFRFKKSSKKDSQTEDVSEDQTTSTLSERGQNDLPLICRIVGNCISMSHCFMSQETIKPYLSQEEMYVKRLKQLKR